MAYKTPAQLKARFEGGDVPTQQDFADLIENTHPGAVNVKAIGAIDVDASVPFLEALANTQVDDGPNTIIMPQGVYNWPTGVEETLTHDLFIIGQGATIHHAADIAPLDFFNSGTITGVSAVANEDRDLSVGAALNTRVTKITAAGHTFVVGDVGKIFSDDVIPGGATGQYIGEFFTVTDVSGSDLWTSGRLIETYATNIKVVKPLTIQFGISGIHFTSSGLGAKTMLNVRGFNRPVIDSISGADLPGVLVAPSGCFQAQVTNITPENTANVPSNSQFGHGILDRSGYQTLVRGLRSARTRHGYTTDIRDTVAGDDNWTGRGRTIGALISDSVDIGSVTGFDTHEDAFDVTFDNCWAIGSYAGESGAGAGFNHRGESGNYNNCGAINGRRAISVDGFTAGKKVVNINNFTYRGDGVNPFQITGGSGDDLTVNLSATIDGGDINGSILDVEEAKVNVSRLDVIYASTDTTPKLISANTNADIRIRSMTLDMEDSTTNSARLAEILAASASIKISGFFGRNTNGKMSQICDMNSNAGTFTFDGEFEVGTISGSGIINTSGGFVGSKFLEDTEERPRARQLVTKSGAETFTLGLGDSLEPAILARITTNAASVIINDVDDGKFWGQIVTINNNDGSSNTLAISDNPGAGLPLVTGGVTLDPGEGLSLMWLGSSWRAMNYS